MLAGFFTLKYDPLGRRIYKSLSSGGTSVFAYDGVNLIEETNSSGTVVARYEQTQTMDEPLAMLRSSATNYYEADGLGSVTSLSNAAGAVAQTYTFDSFGKETRSSVVLDVAKRLGIFAAGQVQFARGTARYRTWRELERRPLDWASRSLVRESLQ